MFFISLFTVSCRLWVRSIFSVFFLCWTTNWTPWFYNWEFGKGKIMNICLMGEVKRKKNPLKAKKQNERLWATVFILRQKKWWVLCELIRKDKIINRSINNSPKCVCVQLWLSSRVYIYTQRSFGSRNGGHLSKIYAKK